jgi:hypothetical protein
MSNAPSNTVPVLPTKDAEKVDGPAESQSAVESAPNAAACRTVETQAATVIQVGVGSGDHSRTRRKLIALSVLEKLSRVP